MENKARAAIEKCSITNCYARNTYVQFADIWQAKPGSGIYGDVPVAEHIKRALDDQTELNCLYFEMGLLWTRHI